MEESEAFSEVEQFLAYLKASHHQSQDYHLEEGDGYSTLLEKGADGPETVFKSIKTLIKTLQDLTRTAERELEVSRKRLLPEVYRKDLYSLPFEVFARILELAYDPENGWTGREQALWVNRYFREVMLKIPKLWTEVDFESFTPNQLARTLSRPLSITLYIPHVDDIQYRRSLEVLSPHVWRWKSLFIVGHQPDDTIDDQNGFVHDRLKQLRDIFRDVAFPALETLYVDYARDYRVDEEDNMLTGGNDPNTSVRSFFSSWNMPALRNLEAVGFIPVLPPSCWNTLTSMGLVLHGGEVYFDLHAIVDLLRSLTSLETLSLDLLIPGWVENEMEPAVLGNLKSLSIESVGLRSNDVQILLDLIRSPNLRNLDIQAGVSSCDEGVQYLDAFFPRDVPRWMELESISCFLEVMDERNSHLSNNPPFEVLCTRLPRLRHLTLQSATTAQPSNLLLHEYFELPSWNRQVTLSTLHIKSCHFFDTSFIVKLGNVINAPEFETLEIHRCPRISGDAMQTILPSGKKFILSPYDWKQERAEFMNARRRPPEAGTLTRLLGRRSALASTRGQNSSQSDQINA